MPNCWSSQTRYILDFSTFIKVGLLEFTKPTDAIGHSGNGLSQWETTLHCNCAHTHNNSWYRKCSFTCQIAKTLGSRLIRSVGSVSNWYLSEGLCHIGPENISKQPGSNSMVALRLMFSSVVICPYLVMTPSYIQRETNIFFCNVFHDKNTQISNICFHTH